MIHRYVMKEGIVSETANDSPFELLTISEPSKITLAQLASDFHLDFGMITSALDSNEISRFEVREGVTYTIFDVPYQEKTGKYGTVPILAACTPEVIIVICAKHTGLMGRFIATDKTLDLSDKTGFIFRLLRAVSSEYQQDLLCIERERKAIETRIRMDADAKDIFSLHELENSLVFFITSLKGCTAVLKMMRDLTNEKIGKPNKEIMRKVEIENRQAIEMATVCREILSSTQDLLSNVINLKLNHSMKTLATATMFLTIPMIITGAYGMNVDLPIQESPYAFGLIVTGTIFLSACIALLLKRKKFV